MLEITSTLEINMTRMIIFCVTLPALVWAQNSVPAQEAVGTANPSGAESTAGSANKDLDLQPGGGWIDTGIDLQPGDTVHFAATGTLQYSNARQSNGPQGLPRGFADLIRNLQVNESGRGAVVGRIGS